MELVVQPASLEKVCAFFWHEWGLLHNLPSLGFQEQEPNVHILAVMVYNQVMGADIDAALQY